MLRRLFTVTVGLLVAVPVLAKNKAEKRLPEDILHAHTVAVMVDPGAGIDIENTRANQAAQKDVETALLNWGIFQPMITSQQADLIIVIRKGHKQVVDQTVSD